jgi:hypothetical protein
LPKLADQAHGSGFKGRTEEDLESWITGTDKGKAFARRMLSALHDPDSPIAQKLNGGALGQDRGGKLRVTEQQFLRGLIGEDGGEVWRSLGEGRQAVADPALLSAEQKQIAELGKSQYQRQLDTQRHLAAGTAEIRRKDPLGAEYKAIRDWIGEAAKDVGVSAVREKLVKTLGDLDYGEAQTPQDVDRLGAREIRNLKSTRGPVAGVRAFLGIEESDSNKKLNEILERMARWLESRGETQRVIIESDGVSHRGVIAQERAGEQ